MSHVGKLRLPGNKSDLIDCLEPYHQSQAEAPSNIDATIIDGPAMVNMLNPGTARTFQQYAEKSIAPYIESQLRYSNRVDVIWDRYISNSLKASTRSKRGTGIRRKVQPNNELPRNWKSFLRVDGNKTDLFEFLAEHIHHMQISIGKLVVTSYGEQVLSNPPRETQSDLAPCTHEKADTRMFVHAVDAVRRGSKRIVIRTVDTDVLVLAIALVLPLKQIDPDVKLWVAFGTGSHFRYFEIHIIAEKLDMEVSQALPFFHAFTGCDTVSSFAGKGKRTAWAAWMAYPEATASFVALTNLPSSLEVDQCMQTIERLVVLMYDRTSPAMLVNDARLQLFSQKGRAFDKIPPTQAALL